MAEETMISYGKSRNRERIAEDEKELERMIKKARGGEEEEEEKEEEEETPKEEPKPKAEEKEDEELTAEERNWKKRYGDLRRREQELAARVRELEAQGEKAADELPTSEEDLEEWKKNHPKVYARVEAIAQKIAEAKMEHANVKLREIEEREQQSKREKAEAEVSKSHPDFDKIRQSDEFHKWVEEQPKWIQDALYENEEDSRSVIRALDLYKLDKGETKKKSPKDPSAMSSVKNKQSQPEVSSSGEKRTLYESDIKKVNLNRMPVDKAEEFMKEIDQARKEGRIIYDLSGKKA